MNTQAQWYCLDCLTSFDTDLKSCSNLSCLAERPSKGWERILQPEQIFDRRFKVLKLLAIGGAGITYLVRELNVQNDKDGPLLAVKVLFTGRDSGAYLHRLSNEAQILEQLAHPHIIEYRGFSHLSGNAPYLVTRFANGGSLMEHLRKHGPLRPKSIFAIGAQICSALKEAHKLGVIHRDLKPDNILLAQKNHADGPFHALIADFGIAKVESAIHSELTSIGTFVGTPNFAAPEQFMAQHITESIDVYATCAMLYYSLTGQYVFKFSRSLSHSQIIETLMNNLPPALPVISASDKEIKILTQIFHEGLQFDHTKRATLESLFQWCIEGTELCFKESLNRNGPSVSFPVVEMISNKTSGGIIKPPLTPNEIYGQDSTVKPSELNNGQTEDSSGWPIPSSDHTVFPPHSDSHSPPKSNNEQETIDVDSLKIQAHESEASEAHDNDASESQTDEERLVDSLLEHIHDDTASSNSQFSTVDISGNPNEGYADESLQNQLVHTIPNIINTPHTSSTDKSTNMMSSKSLVFGRRSSVFYGLLFLLAGSVLGVGIWKNFLEPTQNESKAESSEAIVEPVDFTQELALIQSNLSALTPGIQQRCQIEHGAVSIVFQLNEAGQVIGSVSSKSKGIVNIDCITTVLKTRTFERYTLGTIEVKYQAKW